MNKPGIFAAVAVVIIGAIAIWGASTASAPSAPPVGAQIEPLPMMAHAHALPVQPIADFSLVFVEPISPAPR